MTNGDRNRLGYGMVNTPATYCVRPAVTFERSLLVTAVQLLHDGLPYRPLGRKSLDVDRFVYVHDRLREAPLVQVVTRDMRFDALTAFTDFVAAVIAKHDAESPFSLEAL